MWAEYCITLDNNGPETSILEFDNKDVAIRFWMQVELTMIAISDDGPIFESERITLDQLQRFINEYFDPEVVVCREI